MSIGVSRRPYWYLKFCRPVILKEAKEIQDERGREDVLYNTAADMVDLVVTQHDADFAPAEHAVKAILDVKEEKKWAKEEHRRIKKERAASVKRLRHHPSVVILG